MAPSEPPPDREPDRTSRGYARMRAANDAARERLQPLEPGERPLVLTISALLAAAVAIANIVLVATGWQLSTIEQPGLAQSLLLPAFMLALAAGIWRRRYWAQLAFQAVLTVTILFAFIFLLRASNLEAVLLSLLVVAVCATLFWFLVRAMARSQMPRQTSGQAGR